MNYYTVFLSIKTIFKRGLVKSDDILRRDVGLDVVDVIKHVTAAGFPYLQIAADMLADNFRRSRRQHMLGVDCTAPKHALLAKLRFQFLRRHVFRTNLYGVNDMDAVIQQIW